MRSLLIWIALSLCCAAAAPAEPPKNLHLTFVGDIMTHPLIFEPGDYRQLYRGVQDVFRGSDVSFANLEFPVDPARASTGYPLFNAHADYVRAAVDAGVKVFSTANNHAFDGREEGIFQTIRTLVSLRAEAGGDLFFSGTRGNPAAPFVPETITVRGMRIGFIAVTQFLNEGDGGRFVHTVDYRAAEQADSFVSFVKEASPFFDVFVVSYHGDQEYVPEPDPGKRAFFRRLVDSGAQIVYAHHPHVLQEYELVRVGGSRRLIMYSMGNFISGMILRREEPPDPDSVLALTGDSIMLGVDVSVGGGGASVTGLEPVAVGDCRDANGEAVVAKLDDLADGKAGVPGRWAAYFSLRRSRIAALLARCGAAARAALTADR